MKIKNFQAFKFPKKGGNSNMTKKCIYCGAEIPNESVIDFCDKCGKSIWGEKMFNAIVQNMEEARENGDLCHANLFVGSPDKFNELRKV